MTEQAEVWAIISAFRPGEQLIEIVDVVRPQVSQVVVVDDGSGARYDGFFVRVAEAGARVVRSDENSGIAAALNIGIAQALAGGASAVLTLDQDSSLSSGLVDGLLAAYRRAREDGVRVGAVVPEWFAGVRQARGVADALYSAAADVIQSGMLLPSEAVRRVGALREDFFIDRVDTEYELRLDATGFAVIAASGQRLGHELGAQYRRPLSSHVSALPSVMTLSAPFRYYYRARNRLVLTRLYLRRYPVRMIRAVVWEGLHFLEALAVASPRRDFLRMMRAAIYAARHDRMGRMPAPVAELAAGIRWRVAPLVPDASGQR